MYELIKIEQKDDMQLVSARELHEYLQVNSRFNDWIKGRIEKYQFEDGVDYTKILVQCVRGQNEYDYAITLDMAKELCMVQNNELGRQARKYFIDCERQLNEVPRDVRILLDMAKMASSKRLKDKVINKALELMNVSERTIDTQTEVLTFVDETEFDGLSICECYDNYKACTQQPVSKIAFCKQVYSKGYKRKQIKDRNQKSCYVFERVVL